jgi:transposase
LSKRRTRSPEFKTKVAMEAINLRKTIQEIAADRAIEVRNASQLLMKADPGEPLEAAAAL